MAEKKAMVLHIKNMVCPRCITVVRDTLEGLGLTVNEVELGRASVEGGAKIALSTVNEELQKHGFELLREKEQQLIEQIKALLIRYVQELEKDDEVPKLSEFLANQLHQHYSSLSTAFSQSEDITLEKYLIHLKIERVKELLSYEELTLSEIAYKLSYSSVSHLSNQFKQVTGMSVTDYKKAKDSFRKPLDRIERE